jgi:hypothetical protein
LQVRVILGAVLSKNNKTRTRARNNQGAKAPYLIKAKRKGESPVVHGCDVYEVRQGQRMRIDQPNFTYHVGGNEDLTIEVAAADMGLPESASIFSIPLANIRASMKGGDVVFQADDDLE